MHVGAIIMMILSFFGGIFSPSQQNNPNTQRLIHQSTPSATTIAKVEAQDLSGWNYYSFTSTTTNFPSIIFKYPSELGKPINDLRLIHGTGVLAGDLKITFPFTDPSEQELVAKADISGSYKVANTIAGSGNMLYMEIRTFSTPLGGSSMKTLSYAGYLAENFDDGFNGPARYFTVDGHSAAGAKDTHGSNGALYVVNLSPSPAQPLLLEVEMIGDSSIFTEKDPDGFSVSDRMLMSMKFQHATAAQ